MLRRTAHNTQQSTRRNSRHRSTAAAPAKLQRAKVPCQRPQARYGACARGGSRRCWRASAAAAIVPVHGRHPVFHILGLRTGQARRGGGPWAGWGAGLCRGGCASGQRDTTGGAWLHPSRVLRHTPAEQARRRVDMTCGALRMFMALRCCRQCTWLGGGGIMPYADRGRCSQSSSPSSAAPLSAPAVGAAMPQAGHQITSSL